MSRKRCGTLAAGSLRVCAYHGQASLCPHYPSRVFRGAQPLRQESGESHLTIVLTQQKRVQGYIPAEGLGVSPNSLISPKSGGRGLRGSHEAAWRAGAQEATSPFRAKWRRNSDRL